MLVALMMLSNRSDSLKARYWAWLEEEILEPLRDDSPTIYKEILATISRIIVDQADELSRVKESEA